MTPPDPPTLIATETQMAQTSSPMAEYGTDLFRAQEARDSWQRQCKREEERANAAAEDARMRLAQKPYDEAFALVLPIIETLLKAPVSDVGYAAETAANEVLEAAFRHTFDADWKALTKAEAEASRRCGELLMEIGTKSKRIASLEAQIATWGIVGHRCPPRS